MPRHIASMNEHYAPISFSQKTLGSRKVAHLGQGGFADVIRSKRISDGKIFALKCIKEEMANKEVIVRECALNKVLHCQYIVHLEEIL